MHWTGNMLCFFLLVCYFSSVAGSELLSPDRRFWIIESFSIEEEHPGPFPYVVGKINIGWKYRVFFDLFGEGVDEEPKGVFSIHKETGVVSVHKAVDYEKKSVFKLKFEARKTDLSVDTELGIEIFIRDINDNPPCFQRDLYEIRVPEEDPQGSQLLTVVAHDKDQRGTPNSTFHYEITSVSPNPEDTEFFIDDSGTISFKGCLDHEVAERFTVLVEAKDHGEVVSLSSSTTVIIHVQDGNNHLPTISGHTGSGKVKEHETGTSPLRLHVIDKDSPNSPAWRAKYAIQGDDGEHFKIETDRDNNDGILTVVKPLDFEEAAQRQLYISVENEVPYFSCKVKEKTSAGFWKTGSDDEPGAGQRHFVKVSIEVEDTNDPPVFSVTVKDVVLEENSPVGTWVERVSAADPDASGAPDVVYKMGSDPAGWLTVDPRTGDVTTVNTPDRESPHVVNGVYTVILNGVDNGSPPMTGTTTLNIQVIDQNDNVPQPTADRVDVCVSDRPTTTNITASDPDGNPFAGPFSFELLGEFDGRWKLSPSYGYTAGLVKDPHVYSGLHKINLKISDIQGEFGVYTISVSVCDCSVTANCWSRRETATKAASGAIGVVLAALFLLLSTLLSAVAISCKKKFTTLPTGNSSGETLLASNIEKPGTDCKLPINVLVVSADHRNYNPSDWQSQYGGISPGQFFTKEMEQNFIHSHFETFRRENVFDLCTERWNQTDWNSLITKSYHGPHQINHLSTKFPYKHLSGYMSNAATQALLHKRLHSLQYTENNVLEYHPHVYADEEDSDNVSELENITIPDEDSFQTTLKDLGPEFLQLASICKPPHIEN